MRQGWHKIGLGLMLLLLPQMVMPKGVTKGGVALVLSGGAARGITHLGVIKALEENNIPIDYIAGTSMGAIVGGLYASGWTVEEMAALIGSQEFRNWFAGEIDPKDKYYYRQAPTNPSWLSVSAKLDSKNKIADNPYAQPVTQDKAHKKRSKFTFTPYFLPIAFSNPQLTNVAILKTFGAINGATKGDFNRLMIPFRCVASDIYEKKAVVFSKGDFGDAIRASMSFPFMFRPVECEGKLLYDGGIYNNFPVDVAQKDFRPSYIIGSNVSHNTGHPDKRNLIALLEKMIVHDTDYSVDDGLLLNFSWDKINSWDFAQVETLMQTGYDSTMAHMDEIKQAVRKRQPQDQLDQKRAEFKSRIPPFIFKEVEFEGVTEQMTQYLESVFMDAQHQEFDYDTFLKNYYKLISDDEITEVIPHAVYDEKLEGFRLRLDVSVHDQLQASIGGNISTSTPTQFYLGLGYHDMRAFPIATNLEVQVGRTYNNVSLSARFDFTPAFYLKTDFVAHRFDYYEDTKFFYRSHHEPVFKQLEMYGKVAIGFPVTMKARAEIGVGGVGQKDDYMQSKFQLLTDSVQDRSKNSLFSVFLNMEGSTLNQPFYPCEGQRWKVGLSLLGGTETLQSKGVSTKGKFDLFTMIKGRYEGYFRLASCFSLGFEAEGVYSSRAFLSNYAETIIQAPHFAPTPHSKAVYNTEFSANQYLAAGLKPIFLIGSSNFQIRLEGYVFVPGQTIRISKDYKPYYSKPFDDVRFMTEISSVYTFRKVAVSLYANWYSVPAHNWNIGLNIGLLLYKDKFLQ